MNAERSSFLFSDDRLAGLLAIGGMLLIVVVSILLFDTYWGDPTIYLPYARNIARGDFFSYDPGAFSSGSTSPLWAMILSIPFLFGAGPAGAKVVALLFTLAAYICVLAAARRFTTSRIAASLAAMYAVEMMTLYGVLMYESSLIVGLVALSLIACANVVERWRSGDEGVGSVLPLVAIWWAIPIARPDATAIVAIEAAAIWIASGNRSARRLLLLLGAGAVAAVPSLLYFGYSKLALGVFQVSAQNRAFALREMAQRIGPIFFSKLALGYLGSILYALLLAALGLDLIARDERRRWVRLASIAALLLYPFLLVFVSPVTNDLARYFLPIAPFIVVAGARALQEWGERVKASGIVAWIATLAAVALLFAIKPAASLLGDAVDQRGRGYTFDEIVERDAIERVNALARPGDTLLAYEVQDRYYLRDDVGLLSLDGITDGKVGTYMESGKMEEFVKRYRPRFWLANDAVNYRPYLRRSFLHQVHERFLGDTTLSRLESGGVIFTVVERRGRPIPRGFAGWTMLFELQYE